MSGIIVIGGGQAGSSLTAKLRALGYDGRCHPDRRGARAALSAPAAVQGLPAGGNGGRAAISAPCATSTRNSGIANCASVRTGRGDRPGGPDNHRSMARTLSYDQLALTTGSDATAACRRQSAAICRGVYEVRTLADVDRMAPEFQGGPPASLSSAAATSGWRPRRSPSKLGLKVTLVEMAERILQRVAAP